MSQEQQPQDPQQQHHLHNVLLQLQHAQNHAANSQPPQSTAAQLAALAPPSTIDFNSLWRWGGIPVSNVTEVLALAAQNTMISEATKASMEKHLPTLSLEALSAVFCSDALAVSDAAAAVGLDIASFLGVQSVVNRLLQAPGPVAEHLQSRKRSRAELTAGSSSSSVNYTGPSTLYEHMLLASQRESTGVSEGSASGAMHVNTVPPQLRYEGINGSTTLKAAATTTPVTTVGSLVRKVVIWLDAACALPNDSSAVQIDASVGQSRSARQNFINYFRALSEQGYPFASSDVANTCLINDLKKGIVTLDGREFDLGVERMKNMGKVDSARWARIFGHSDEGVRLRAQVNGDAAAAVASSAAAAATTAAASNKSNSSSSNGSSSISSAPSILISAVGDAPHPHAVIGGASTSV